MRNYDSTILDLEKEYWRLMDEVDFFEYLIPQNTAEEKQRFLSELSKDKKYNPRFVYKPISFNVKKLTATLNSLKNRLLDIDHPLSRYYERYFEQDIDFIHNISRRSSILFPSWLSGLYGFPNENEYNIAKSILEKIDVNETRHIEYTLSPETMKTEIHKILEDCQITDWRISLTASSARFSVNPVTKTIKIEKDTFFNPDEIQRLLLHEIGVHVLRSENGSKQRFLLFSKGFPDYLQTEEGLAILSEKRNGLLNNIALTKYCCRLLAAHLCQYLDFYKVFRQISIFLSAKDSFDIVARIKRGLEDTSTPGGFTKDQIYIKGLLELEGLELQSIRQLFVGKIGIQDLNIIDKIYMNYEISYPKWLEGK